MSKFEGLIKELYKKGWRTDSGDSFSLDNPSKKEDPYTVNKADPEDEQKKLRTNKPKKESFEGLVENNLSERSDNITIEVKENGRTVKFIEVDTSYGDTADNMLDWVYMALRRNGFLFQSSPRSKYDNWDNRNIRASKQDWVDLTSDGNIPY